MLIIIIKKNRKNGVIKILTFMVVLISLFSYVKPLSFYFSFKHLIASLC